MRRVLWFFPAALAIAGCASTGITPADGGSYLISQKTAQVGFGPPDGAKADIYQEANAFCDKQNKKVETVDLKTTNSGFARAGSASLQFRCI